MLSIKHRAKTQISQKIILFSIVEAFPGVFFMDYIQSNAASFFYKTFAASCKGFSLFSPPFCAICDLNILQFVWRYLGNNKFKSSSQFDTWKSCKHKHGDGWDGFAQACLLMLQ